MKKSNQIERDINRVLSTWNPIEVPANAALSEYRSYVPQIIGAASSRRGLVEVLADILVNCMGLAFDRQEPQHVSELEGVAQAIQRVCLRGATPAPYSERHAECLTQDPTMYAGHHLVGG
jgi:hypothetical protein